LGGSGLIESLFGVCAKFEVCWLVVEDFSDPEPRVPSAGARLTKGDIPLLLASVSGFAHVGLEVRILHSSGTEETAQLIRTVGHLAREASHQREVWKREQWIAREWLSPKESTVRGWWCFLHGALCLEWLTVFALIAREIPVLVPLCEPLHCPNPPLNCQPEGAGCGDPKRVGTEISLDPPAFSGEFPVSTL